MIQRNIEYTSEQLARNAFDFLERAVKEIDERPKYAVVHFAIAVELFLKSRLMKDHWTLIVENVSKAERNQFLSGESKTIGLNDAIERLKKVCGEVIPADAVRQFKNIAAHRNRMIHFFHEADAKGADQNLIQQIVREQCLCWYYLEQLLERWQVQFYGQEKEIGKIRKLMRKNGSYLDVAFDQIRSDIEEEKSKGVRFRPCSGCEHESAKVTEDSSSKDLFTQTCRVCNLTEFFVEIDCPKECGGKVCISERKRTRCCQTCKHEVSSEELISFLSTSRDRYAQNANCAECSSHDSVVEHNAIYICVECLKTGDEEEIAICQWCSESQMGGGSLEWSALEGCGFCSGHPEWPGVR